MQRFAVELAQSGFSSMWMVNASKYEIRDESPRQCECGRERERTGTGW
jgi:hypothetical protein